MSVQFLNRRALLGYGVSAVLVARIPKILAQTSNELEALALERVSSGTELMSPETTGSVDEGVRRALSTFVAGIGTVWEFSVDEETLNQFNRDLDIKTNAGLRVENIRHPSYLVEYQNAATLVNAAWKEFGDTAAATMFLLFTTFSDSPLDGARITHAREWVFKELTTYIVAKAGFKRFGLINYPGYFGGSYLSETSFRRYAE